jgi:hypothetical protein
MTAIQRLLYALSGMDPKRRLGLLKAIAGHVGAL